MALFSFGGRAMVRCMVFVALLAPQMAWALWDTRIHAILEQSGASAVTARPGGRVEGPSGLTWVNTPGVAGSVDGSRSVSGPGPLRPTTVRATVSITGAVAARTILRALPVLGTVLVVADALNDAGIREAPGGQIEWHPAVSQQHGVIWWVGDSTWFAGASTITRRSTPEETRAVAIAEFNARSVPYLVSGRDCWRDTRSDVPGTSGFLVRRYTRPNDPTCAGPLSFISQFTQDWSLNQTSGMRCPPGTTPAPHDVAICLDRTQWHVVSEPEALARLEPRVSNNPLPIVDAIDVSGVPMPTGVPHLAPTEPPQVGRETSQFPDGTTRVIDTSFQWVPGDGRYEWRETRTERSFPPGVTPPSPGAITDGIVTQPLPARPLEVIVCGLPSTPPCRIDETGTPQGVEPFGALQPSDWFQPLRGVIENPQIADTGWNFGFSLPTGCTPLSLDFGGHALSLDPCQFQGVFHDIMSVVWVITGVIFGITIVGRTFGTVT